MSETLELTLPGGFDVAEIADWGAFAVRNSTQVPALIAAVGDVHDAEPRPVPKWAAAKQVGDILAPIAEDSPIFRQSVTVGDPYEFLKSEQLKFGNGELFNKFLAALPKLIAIATALKPLLT
jgi:hypothetical protein